MRINLRQLFFGWASLLAALVLGLAGYWQLDPVGYRLTVFQPLREVRLLHKELDPIGHWSEIERRIVEEPETVVLDAPESIRLVAGLYRPAEPGPFPAIILAHGSSPYGRKAGLIRLLAATLAEKGWLVLAPDARGYGDSDDPPDLDNPEDFGVSDDFRRWIDYVEARPDVDSDGIYLLGHSQGGSLALEAVLDEPRIKSLILVGPTRYIYGPEDAVSRWSRTRYAADRRFDRPVTIEVMERQRHRGDIALLAEGPLSEPGHKPILLIDGEREGEANLRYLGDVARHIAPPLTYVTLEDTGHYCGVWSYFGSSLVYYRPDLFAPFVNLLTAYLEQQSAGAAREIDVDAPPPT